MPSPAQAAPTDPPLVPAMPLHVQPDVQSDVHDIHDIRDIHASTDIHASSDISSNPEPPSTPSTTTASAPATIHAPPQPPSPYTPGTHAAPPHAFYAAPPPPTPHLYHAHHPPFAYQPPFAYPSAPYFQPHPLYHMHHPNWPPAPAVSHPQFQPPPPQQPQQSLQPPQPPQHPPQPPYYHWAPQTAPQHVPHPHPVSQSQPLPTAVAAAAVPHDPFDQARHRRRQGLPSVNSPRATARHTSRPPHPPDHYASAPYPDRDPSHLHHLAAHHHTHMPHLSASAPQFPSSRRAARRRNPANDLDAADADSVRKDYHVRHNGKHGDAEGKALADRDPLVASSSNVSSVSSTSSSSERKRGNIAHAHKSNGRPPPSVGADSATSPDRELQSLTADLDKSARKAVASDDVTLALLLTSWANSLAEARQHVETPATHFQTVFHASHALRIVASDVLCSQPAADSPVLKALVALFGYVLYGDHRLHTRIAALVVELNARLPAVDAAPAAVRETYMRERDVAVGRMLAFLKDMALNMRAYADILPQSPDVRDKEGSNSTGTAHGSKGNGATGPAGPDPTKAVIRSMDAWRRTIARLQGEMALIVVLKKSLSSADEELTVDREARFAELEEFFSGVRQAVHKHIEGDVAARIDRLNAVYWADVAQGAETTVYQATRERAGQWIGQFESGRGDVERQLDDAGIGFGPSARVSADKMDVLLSASAGVAGLVSCQQHALKWASDTAVVLSCMVSAVRCLQDVDEGRLGPTQEVCRKILSGHDAALDALDEVGGWSFGDLQDKVVGSLAKSAGEVDMTGEVEIENVAPKTRHLRFEEPPKTPVGDSEGGENGMSMNRRKPRHARMKSSPDALLHLNARFDDYSDEDSEMERNVDREIEFNDEKDDETDDDVHATGDESGDEDSSAEGGMVKNEVLVVGSGDSEGVTMVVQMHVGKVDAKVKTEGGDGDEDGDYDGQSVVEYADDEDDDDADDRDIIVHDVVEDEAKPKKVSHSSHMRSMSVDGIPF